MEELSNYLTVNGWKIDWEKSLPNRYVNYLESRINLVLYCDELLINGLSNSEVEIFKNSIILESKVTFFSKNKYDGFKFSSLLPINSKRGKQNISGFSFRMGSKYVEKYFN